MTKRNLFKIFRRIASNAGEQLVNVSDGLRFDNQIKGAAFMQSLFYYVTNLNKQYGYCK